MYIIKNKTVSSAIWYTISSVIAKSISILLTPIFARILTKVEYGYYTSFVSWQNILVTVFSLGLASTVLRAKFDYTDEEFKHYVFSVTVFGIIFSALCVIVGGLVIGDSSFGVLGINKKYIIPLAFVIVFSPLIQIFQAEQRAKVKYVLSSFTTIGFGLFGLLIPMFFISVFNNKLDALLYGIACNALIWSLIIFISYLIKYGTMFKWEYIKYALVLSIPIIPHLVSNNIMGNSDKLMINSICGPKYAAMYGIAYTCSMAVTLLRNALNNAWTPWFYKKMSEKKYDTIKKVTNYYIFWFSLGSLGVCLFGREIVMIMGGKQYLEATSLLPIIMLGCYYNFLNVFYVNIEFYEKKTYMISVITIMTTILNIALNYIYIRKYGYIAAAYTTAFCNFLIVLLHFLVTRKMNNKLICDSKLIFILVFAGLGICMLCIYSYELMILRIVLIVIALIVGLFLLKNTMNVFARRRA